MLAGGNNMTDNDELIKIKKFFLAEKVSLNVEKTSFSLFDYDRRKRSISFSLKKNRDTIR